MTINWQLLMPELIIILTFILVVIFDLFNSLQKTFPLGSQLLALPLPYMFPLICCKLARKAQNLAI